MAELRSNAPSVVERIVPDYKPVYDSLGWTMYPEIDRVYVNARALSALGWQPKYDFLHVLNALSQGDDPCSMLAREIGTKHYHRV